MRINNIGRSSDLFHPCVAFPTSALLLGQWHHGAEILELTAAGLFEILTRFTFNRVYSEPISCKIIANVLIIFHSAKYFLWSRFVRQRQIYTTVTNFPDFSLSYLLHFTANDVTLFTNSDLARVYPSRLLRYSGNRLSFNDSYSLATSWWAMR